MTAPKTEAHRAARTLLQYAARDSDPVSVFSDGTCDADTEAAVFVVRGAELVAYLKGLCERQGLLTAGKGVAP